ncbi:2C-methyl-D-erythritol 2,4-cyclodiphosphate synthase [Syntrophothermus lipocalidus DSM 12680]|uniref:2-C-methyl-D-erythritol 2,4-cyclodiphosphate synthase n=2 Tax=Syntrophothermus TaxID=129001 RepID=D7CJP8_SYNLT|nr:2C-methyl-D-erythritol 2,4-cyclodiphosphate synthase [Syntrophothermus lipocalidus DSM 12680]
MMRIGIGYDAHRLVEGRSLVLGGINIPFDLGLLGHSDADVLTHAVCDALLGAAGLGDLGKHFPDSDERYRNIRSLFLLEQIGEMVRKAGYAVVNIDAVIVAQRPRLAPFVGRMVANLAEVLEIDPVRVNVKATTTEGMGFEGRGEGMSAYAVVLLKNLE